MAELFGETSEAAPDTAFADTGEVPAGVDEDFDLSVFKAEDEGAVAATDDSLFEIGDLEPVEQPVEQVVGAPSAEAAVSRIRALTEERERPGSALVTVLVVLAFLAVTFGGMVLWHLSQGR